MTREEAKEWLMPPTTLSNGNQDDPVNKHWIAYRMAIKALEQQPKTGHWEKTADNYCYWHKCSCCGTKTPKTEWGNDYFSPYCPECGAEMIYPQESEEV